MGVHLGSHDIDLFGGISINQAGGSDNPPANLIPVKTIEENGTYIASDEGADGYESVQVNVQPEDPVLQDVSITPTESKQTISADSNYDAIGTVTVDAISKTYVGSDITRQAAKTVSPTESEQTAVASGVYTTGAVKVGAISSTYVGSGVAKKTSSNLTASGATVTVPAGYYASGASKSVATGSISVNTPSINTSTGVVTASTTLTTAGYVASNPSSKTLNLTTQAAKTVTPTASEQTAVSSGVYTTGAVKVAAVPTETKTVSENGTYTPTSGKFFSGFTVNVPIKKYYVGNTKPSSSIGDNDDLYLKVQGDV